MTAYYNEIDPYAAAWLRNLIAAGHIAPGEVDTRSIEDVHPADLQDFAQCHFFAGIGVWSLALRRAGWGDDRPVWTGSCPCQPFSAAGKGAGFSDERHLWPAFHHLIGQRRPPVVLGEQVASSDVNPWIDLVQDDLEGMGYRVGAVPFPSAGIGAPHIRDRLYWVANADGNGFEPRRQGRKAMGHRPATQPDSGTGGLGNTDSARPHSECWQPQQHQPAREPGLAQDGAVGRLADAGGGDHRPQEYTSSDRQQEADRSSNRVGGCGVSPGWLADCASGGWGEERSDAGRGAVGDRAQGIAPGLVDGGSDLRPGATNGFWRDADWLGCRDGKWRPVEPGTFPLAHGAASRVGRLRAYGNAINAEAARVFIEAVMECQP